MAKKSYGYACINISVNLFKNKKERITTNRSIIKKTFLSRGADYASELALRNCKDILKILQWNEDNNIRFFRLSSDIFPWASEYNLKDLKDYKEIEKALKEVGVFVKNNGHRITSHPGPYNKLASFDDKVVRNTIRDLEIHGEVFDLIGLPRNHYSKINIHVGAAYGAKELSCYNFINNFDRLSESVRSRLTVENDDRLSLYSVKELYESIYLTRKIPIVFDYHHHKFCDGGLSEEQALNLAASTWEGVKPVVHYSESRSFEQGLECRPQAHSDYVYNYIDLYGKDVDVMIEAKAKELAVISYLDLFGEKNG